jgi:hypothetical protein
LDKILGNDPSSKYVFDGFVYVLWGLNLKNVGSLIFIPHFESDRLLYQVQNICRLVFVSTLDGRLSALDPSDGGSVSWSTETGPGQMLSSSIHRLEVTALSNFKAFSCINDVLACHCSEQSRMEWSIWVCRKGFNNDDDDSIKFFITYVLTQHVHRKLQTPLKSNTNISEQITYLKY